MSSAYALEDPTKGKPFFPWLWEDQFQPTLEHATEFGNLGILAAGAVGSIAAFQYETDVYLHNRRGQNLIMSKEDAGSLGTLGGGGLGIGIAVAQLFLDQENGLQHARAIALTSTSHVLLAWAFSKKRPGGREDFLPFPSSFPSGHASSAFATATSLAYSYGYWAGIPAFTLATAIAAARVSENAHWLSDVVAGAALGIYWGRASAQTKMNQAGETRDAWMAFPFRDGFVASYTTEF